MKKDDLVWRCCTHHRARLTVVADTDTWDGKPCVWVEGDRYYLDGTRVTSVAARVPRVIRTLDSPKIFEPRDPVVTAYLRRILDAVQVNTYLPHELGQWVSISRPARQIIWERKRLIDLTNCHTGSPVWLITRDRQSRTPSNIKVTLTRITDHTSYRWIVDGFVFSRNGRAVQGTLSRVTRALLPLDADYDALWLPEDTKREMARLRESYQCRANTGTPIRVLKHPTVRVANNILSQNGGC